jgi:hypothetical protein
MALTEIQKLKIKIMCQGIRISSEAERELTKSGTVPLDLFEYHSTTSGIILILPDNIYVNASFRGNAEKSKIKLDCLSGKLVIIDRRKSYPVKNISLPSDIGKMDKYGFLYSDAVITHGDRIRVSPIFGCAFRCKYCDIHREKYEKIPLAKLLKGIDISLRDKNVKPKHLFISGGTPLDSDKKFLDNVYKKITARCLELGLLVDIMLAPRKERGFLEKLKKWGVSGLAINMEIYNKQIAKEINPQKAAISREFYLDFIARAVGVFGRDNVRSLLIVGLEPLSETLAGVKALAEIGCDVVLSPFIPFEKTVLAHHKAPTARELEKVYLKSMDIINKHGAKIGPRCVPCQHNTLAFPTE